MGYELLTSETTVQVLSPTLSADVIYCTIRTTPSGVIASKPVQPTFFDQGQTAPELTKYAEAIEEIMADSRVVAGTGVQTIDANGLLTDNVAFTVEYVPAGTTPTQITAEAIVPATDLFDPRVTTSGTGIAQARALIDATYANLQEAAGG